MGSLIPEKYMHNISYIWSQSSHAIYVWTDRLNENKNRFFDYLGGYSNPLSLRAAKNRLIFCDIQVLAEYCGSELCQRLTLAQRRMLSQCLVLEYPNYSDRYRGHYDLEVIEKLGNYATLSDLLRLIILYKEGGVYIDCDNAFRGQHLRPDSINKLQSARFEINLPCMVGLYSDQNYAGNSILACNAHALGCLFLLQKTLDVMYRQNKGRETISNLEKYKAMIFSKKSYLKDIFEYFMSNQYIERDQDLRRHGKDPNGYKLDFLKRNGGVVPMMVNEGYPYAGLAIEIGPGALTSFQAENPNLSRRFPSNAGNIFGQIVISSDQAWL